ncbi:hypothetical protein CLF_104765 [Clonorchis sinensis]|uniref:MULE transposase domain-containing protein n=1 Tax=Clonorchis sinensis TaxID=79923 RepID=G7YCA3_CLOSI|nr:hypothetical protein CLF_104765 [Clonorchis sinensis]
MAINIPPVRPLHGHCQTNCTEATINRNPVKQKPSSPATSDDTNHCTSYRSGLQRSSTIESLLFSCYCSVASGASADSPARCTRCSTLNWPVALANRNWTPSAGCTPSPNWSESNCWRNTPSSPGKARSNDCCSVTHGASANSLARCTRCSALNWPATLANRNWTPSAGCTPPTNWSDSNCWRGTPSTLGTARSIDCCRPAKNIVEAQPGLILAVLNCLMASWRSVTKLVGEISNYATPIMSFTNVNSRMDHQAGLRFAEPVIDRTAPVAPHGVYRDELQYGRRSLICLFVKSKSGAILVHSFVLRVLDETKLPQNFNQYFPAFPKIIKSIIKQRTNHMPKTFTGLINNGWAIQCGWLFYSINFTVHGSGEDDNCRLYLIWVHLAVVTELYCYGCLKEKKWYTTSPFGVKVAQDIMHTTSEGAPGVVANLKGVSTPTNYDRTLLTCSLTFKSINPAFAKEKCTLFMLSMKNLGFIVDEHRYDQTRPTEESRRASGRFDLGKLISWFLESAVKARITDAKLHRPNPQASVATLRKPPNSMLRQKMKVKVFGGIPHQYNLTTCSQKMLRPRSLSRTRLLQMSGCLPPQDKFLYDRLPVNRRLTEDELSTCRALLKYGTPSCEMWQFVADEFGRIFTNQDIYNYRRKCRPVLPSRYKLYTFLVTEGMAIGRSVIIAFLESEQFVPMHKLFDLSKETMGEHSPFRTFVMDKLVAQLLGARVVFGCDVMLCYIHIRKAIRKHAPSANGRHICPRMARLGNAVQWVLLFIVLQTHRFRQDLQLLRQTDPRFVSYHTARWSYITRKWTVHAQSGMVHFGHVTNSLLENANGQLEDQVHHADTLEHAIQKVSRHAK